MSGLRRIGVLGHPTRPQSAPIVERIAEMLRARGLETWQRQVWTEAEVRDVLAQADTDMVIAIGGDGAMLRAARFCAHFGVPLLGVNMGFLGFLTEIKALEDWDGTIDALLAGDYWIETRMLIQVALERDGVRLAESEALNDAVVSRGKLPRTIRLEAYIDGNWITTYNADALIIATATGSTAYALACGGPILPPELRNILVVPVAPHLSLDRPIVLPEGATVEVLITPEAEVEIALSVDGTLLADLREGDRVIVQASAYVSRFVRLRDRNYFYRSLLDRLEPRISAPGRP